MSSSSPVNSYFILLGLLTEVTNPQLRKLNQKADNWTNEWQFFLLDIIVNIFY